MVHEYRGFTIVELVIVISVIGILATISVIGFSQYQSEGRDTVRESRATAISEALEKYYDENGEYPSCAQITQSASTVSESVLEGINVDALETPTGSGNSITCNDLTSAEDGDYFAYVGDSSATCTGPSGTACSLFRIKYKKERDGAIAVINSRRTVTLSASDVPQLSAFTGTSFTQISGSWTPISGAITYDVQRSTSSNFSVSPVTTSTSSTSQVFSSLSYGTNYHFRVRAVGAAGPGDWSSSTSASTWSLTAPCNVAGTSNSITQVTFSWCAVNHATSYNIQWNTTGNFSSSYNSTTSTTLSKALTGLTAGTTYYARIQAVNGSYTSPWSATASVIAGLAAPSLTATAASTTSINLSWPTLSGATGYILERAEASNFPAGSTTSSTPSGNSTSATGLIPNKTYYFRLKGTIGSYQGPYSSTASALTLTPTVVLTGAKYCGGAYSGRPSYHLRLRLTEVSYNLTANTSNVNWHLYRVYVSGNWGSWDQSKTWPWAVSINGSSWSGSSNSSAFRYSGQNTSIEETISSGSLTVAHNADGTKTIGYSASDGPGSNIFGSASCSGSYVLSDLR